MIRDTIKNIKTEYESACKGALPFCSFMGGYPYIYITERGEALCDDCASRLPDDEEIVYDVHWESNGLYCSECGKLLPYAYETGTGVSVDACI